jgi:sugar phosphate isomerase/epimerase
MKLSCTTAIVSSVPVRERLRLVADAGFTHISPSQGIRESTLFFNRKLARMRRVWEAHGLAVDWFHAPWTDLPALCDPNPGLRGIAAGALSYALEQIASVKARCMVVHAIGKALPEGVSLEEAKQLIGEAIEQLVEMARDLGVLIAVENLSRPVNYRINEYLLDALPALGLCLDAGHALVAGNLPELLERYAGRVVCTHFHDNHGRADEHLLPGDGIADWVRIQRELAAAGYGGPWGCETIIDDRNGSSRLEARAIVVEAAKRMRLIAQGKAPA